MRRVLAALAILGAIGACREYPTRALQRDPVISSVVVFPTTLGPGDSAIVTIFASDPDGDALYYDWYFGGPLFAPDAWMGALIHTRSNSQVFHRAASATSNDSARVSCYATDGKGGYSDGRSVWIFFRD